MKAALILAITVAGTVGTQGQGTINFAETGNVTVRIYAPGFNGSGFETIGNSAADIPAGTTVYTTPPLGGASTGSFGSGLLAFDGGPGYGNGNNFTAELYGVAGTTASISQVLASPLTQYSSTFSTKLSGAGQFVGSSPNNDPGIPGATGSLGASLSLAVWYNAGGTITSLAAAEAARLPYGWSPLFTINGPLGDQGSPPTPPPDLVGLQSFDLIGPIPEPGMSALCAMGAVALLAYRRKR